MQTDSSLQFGHGRSRLPRRRLVTAEEVARYFCVSTDSIYRMAREAQIPCVRIGRLVRFDLDVVEAALVGDEAVATAR